MVNRTAGALLFCLFLVFALLPALPGQAGGYEHEADLFGDGTFIVSWTVADGVLDMSVAGKTDGWVSIGFMPSSMMKDADMVFGWADGPGNGTVLDCYSTGRTGPHPEDTGLGGTDDLRDATAVQDGGWTTMVFTRDLATGDEYDHDLPASGGFDIIWGMGQGDGLSPFHSRVGSGTLDLATGKATGGEKVRLWPLHALLMILGFVLLGAGTGIARFGRNKAWWLKAHRGVNISGAVSALFGLAMGIYMVQVSTGVHFGVPHAYAGALTIIAVLTMPVLGFLMLKVQKGAGGLRKAHRILGRVTLGLMLVTMVFGFLAALVFR